MKGLGHARAFPMKMAAPDVVLFIVGALLFGGASAAIVTSGGGLDALTGGGSPSGAYRVAYHTDAHDSDPVAVPSFTSASGEFEVNNTDIFRFTLLVDCTDPANNPAVPYRLTITLTPPAGSNLTAEPVTASCAPGIEVPVEVAAVPSETTVQGRTEQEARENIPRDANSTKAQGTWAWSITGARGAIPGALPAPAPGGAVSSRVEGWHPEFTPVPK